jgi:hypothetical protein
MEFILSAIAESDDTIAHELRTSFNILLLKADAGIAKGSYIPRPRATITDKLGFSISSPEESRYLAGEMTPEEEDAYLNNLMKGESI